MKGPGFLSQQKGGKCSHEDEVGTTQTRGGGAGEQAGGSRGRGQMGVPWRGPLSPPSGQAGWIQGELRPLHSAPSLLRPYPVPTPVSTAVSIPSLFFSLYSISPHSLLRLYSVSTPSLLQALLHLYSISIPSLPQSLLQSLFRLYSLVSTPVSAPFSRTRLV